MARVTFENVGKIFSAGRGSPISAVRELSFSIDAGEFAIITGPSGCGKTTTLRLIAGLEQPTSGKVLLDGEPLDRLPMEQRDIAMVFQNGALYPHMTAFENMAFGLKIRNMSRTEIRDRVRETASWLELDDCLGRLPRQLSGGQSQRLAIGRALARRPGIVLFDEPFSNVDVQLRARLREDLLKLHQQTQATFVYVTHDQMEGLTLGSKIIVMQEGKQVQISSPRRTYDFPENLFVARFFGSPAMNLVSGQLSQRDDRIWFQAKQEKAGITFGMALPRAILSPGGSPPETVMLGIRPDDIAESAGKAASNPGVFPATVERVRAIGWETQVDFDVAGTTFVARMPRGCALDAGQSTELAFNLSRVHLFDSGTGKRLNQETT